MSVGEYVGIRLTLSEARKMYKEWRFQFMNNGTGAGWKEWMYYELALKERDILKKRNAYLEERLAAEKEAKLRWVDWYFTGSEQWRHVAYKFRVKLVEERRKVALLREALEAVEWVNDSDYGYGCPWCGADSYPLFSPPEHHKPDCQRQAALKETDQDEQA